LLRDANGDGTVDARTRIEEAGRTILDLPAGGYNNHWTRNIITNRDETKLYVSVGSASNVGRCERA
jgi:glucose/arabinose dehydrogenase